MPRCTDFFGGATTRQSIKLIPTVQGKVQMRGQPGGHGLLQGVHACPYAPTVAPLLLVDKKELILGKISRCYTQSIYKHAQISKPSLGTCCSRCGTISWPSCVFDLMISTSFSRYITEKSANHIPTTTISTTYHTLWTLLSTCSTTATAPSLACEEK